MSTAFGRHHRALPHADGLVIGNLANGVKYYVWNHPEPKGYCEFRLCVSVGSWFERDNESGLAHFVEHMAFKTTSRFTDQGGVIRFLQSKGAQYGHDLNANTGLFETVYKFQLPIRNGLKDLDDGLLVLAEWAFGIRATAEDVESERPIIREEWRTKRGAKERLKAKYWREAVSPRVAARFPIGDLAVIENVTPLQVQAFYHSWYRPERMAVVVVGDIGACEEPEAISAIINSLREHFVTSEPIHNGPQQRTQDAPADTEQAQVPAHTPLTALAAPKTASKIDNTSGQADVVLSPPEPNVGAIALLLQDPEVTSCTASLELLHALPVSDDVDHLEREVTRRLFLTILDRRFTALTRGGKSGCPPNILDVAVASRPLLPTLLCTSVTATLATEDGVLENIVRDALACLARGLYSIGKVGVSKSEVAHAINAWTPAFSPDRAIIGEELVDDCMQHFRLKGNVPLAGPQNEMEACRAFLERREDVTEAISKLALLLCPINSDGAWRILVQTGPGPEMDIKSIWKDAASAAMASPALPQNDAGKSADEILAAREKALVDMLLPWTNTEVSIASKMLPTIGAIEFTLANGIRACCMRRDTPGHIALQAFVLGGSTEIDEADECAMEVLDEVALASGLGLDLDGAALAELQSATQTRVNTQKHLYHRGVGGSTSTGRLGLLLKLVAARLRVSAARFELEDASTAVSRARARFTEDIKNREQGPHYKLGQRARILSCGGADIPVLRPVSADSVKQLTARKCASLHARGFATAPAQLTFVLVGDLPPEVELGRLLSQHFSCLPGGEDPWLRPGQSLPSALPSDFAHGVVRERIRSRSAEKATVLIIFHAVVPREDAGIAHLDAVLTIQAICRCAEDRLLARLRGEAGGVYSVSVGFGRTSLSPHGHISISFTCEPSSSDALASRVLDELKDLQVAGPTEVEASNILKALVETHARNLAGKSANSYWLFYILDAYKGERLRFAKTLGLPAPSMDVSRVEKAVWASSHGRAERLTSLATPELLRKSFGEYFDLGNYVHLVLEPEAERIVDDNVDEELERSTAENTKRPKVSP